MATAQFTIATAGTRSTAGHLRAVMIVLAGAGLAPGLFGLVNLGAEALDVLPLFFAPFGLPGWMGGAAHLGQLALLGAAFGVLLTVAAPRGRHWLAALIAAYIALPFITPPLDSLQLSLVCTALFLLGLATLRRVGATSPLAGWLLTPMLAIVGFSASMGLVLTAAYTPPFALMQGQNSTTPAA
ncbi:hypothetical protein O9Z70_12670 [Devosia sp. YIM 151766]|uniref:hypothetical protein n=1 Tax=Devosia sp. YIM 151766 TaxID=3017325 RepID=UPI00255CAEFE|nr:hypothetical protein [Devosia sp. YIM 151766]WIY52307.1 hypothetical protein O9Z70_12670 [Devosia sp. YIM 151766]